MTLEEINLLGAKYTFVMLMATAPRDLFIWCYT